MLARKENSKPAKKATYHRVLGSMNVIPLTIFSAIGVSSPLSLLRVYRTRSSTTGKVVLSISVDALPFVSDILQQKEKSTGANTALFPFYAAQKEKMAFSSISELGLKAGDFVSGDKPKGFKGSKVVHVRNKARNKIPALADVSVLDTTELTTDYLVGKMGSDGKLELFVCLQFKVKGAIKFSGKHLLPMSEEMWKRVSLKAWQKGFLRDSGNEGGVGSSRANSAKQFIPPLHPDVFKELQSEKPAQSSSSSQGEKRPRSPSPSPDEEEPKRVRTGTRAPNHFEVPSIFANLFDEDKVLAVVVATSESMRCEDGADGVELYFTAYSALLDLAQQLQIEMPVTEAEVGDEIIQEEIGRILSLAVGAVMTASGHSPSNPIAHPALATLYTPPTTDPLHNSFLRMKRVTTEEELNGWIGLALSRNIDQKTVESPHFAYAALLGITMALIHYTLV